MTKIMISLLYLTPVFRKRKGGPVLKPGAPEHPENLARVKMKNRMETLTLTCKIFNAISVCFICFFLVMPGLFRWVLVHAKKRAGKFH